MPTRTPQAAAAELQATTKSPRRGSRACSRSGTTRRSLSLGEEGAGIGDERVGCQAGWQPALRQARRASRCRGQLGRYRHRMRRIVGSRFLPEARGFVQLQQHRCPARSAATMDELDSQSPLSFGKWVRTLGPAEESPLHERPFTRLIVLQQAGSLS